MAHNDASIEIEKKKSSVINGEFWTNILIKAPTTDGTVPTVPNFTHFDWSVFLKSKSDKIVFSFSFFFFSPIRFS